MYFGTDYEQVGDWRNDFGSIKEVMGIYSNLKAIELIRFD